MVWGKELLGAMPQGKVNELSSFTTQFEIFKLMFLAQRETETLIKITLIITKYKIIKRVKKNNNREKINI